MILPVVCQTLVEQTALVCSNIRRVTRPYRLCLVEFFVRGLLLLDLLRFLLLGFVFLILDLLDLGLFLSLLFFLRLRLVILDFLWQ